MRLLIDMNLSPRWIDVFAVAQIEAVHRSSVGPAIADDRSIMAFALRSGAVVLTHDLDFGSILAVTGSTGPSVIQIRAGDVRPEAAGAAVLSAVRQCAADLAAGALLTVDALRFRVSLMPLGR